MDVVVTVAVDVILVLDVVLAVAAVLSLGDAIFVVVNLESVQTPNRIHTP